MKNNFEKHASGSNASFPFVNYHSHILQELYTGDFQPGEEIAALRTTRQKELTQTLSKLEEKIQTKLSTDDWALVEQYCQTIVDRDAEELSVTFEAGFRTATQLLIAGLSIPVKGNAD